MAEARTAGPEGVVRTSKLRIAEVASRQGGQITVAQLRRLGVGKTTVAQWTHAGYLYARLPGVYAVGQPGATTESTLWEAVLFAGPGAMLSHLSAAWWQELIRYPPNAVHVSTPRRTRPRRGIVIHDRRRLDRCEHRGIPVTSVQRTILDLASTGEEMLLRRALAVLDFQGRLDARELLAMSGQGRPGTAMLRSALTRHEPRLARTLSTLEDDFLVLCEQRDIPKPDEVNVRIHGILCDAVYHAAKVIVEFDGAGNHHSPAQMRRDRANDFTLRAHGWLVLRYSWQQVHDDGDGIRDEITRALAARVAV